jgi:hypothetical protein
MKQAELRNTCLVLRKTAFRVLLCFVFIAVVFVLFFTISGYFIAVKNRTYLPEIQSGDLEINPAVLNQIELKSPWYILSVDKYGRVAVKTSEGEIIMSSLTYYSAYEGALENWELNNVSVKLDNDSTISILGEGHKGVLVNVLLTVRKNIPKVDVNIRTHYNVNAVVKREALVAKFDVPLSEVYLKNGKIDIKPHFDTEYWLQQQGARFGTGSRSSLIYHTPHVSSLQLSSEKNMLFVNLDYILDHPYVKIPYQKDGGGKWENHSASNYSSGDERSDNFSIFFGNLPKVVPRLMLVPQGYLAGYIFTEHADSGNIKTQRAAYFGAEDIVNISDAIGGFVGYKIPVTKSVFYADTARGCPSGSSIRDDPDEPQFLNFLDQLNSTGLYDICLHTPEWNSSTRESLAEAIRFMKDRFNTCTWIDHGIYSGKTNRESFVCDGLNPKSEYFAADLWEEYDTRYFWNTSDELMHIPSVSLKEELRKLRFKNISVELWKRYLYQRRCNGMTVINAFFELMRGNSPKYESNSLQPFKGNSYPTPLYWQNLTSTKHFYSWATNYDEDYTGLSTNKAEAQFNKVQQQLNLLLSNWGIFINHGYFVRNRKGYGVLTNNNGRIVINPFFDKILALMASKRDNGDLYITTIRDLLDYWILLENISFEYMPDGTIYIYNDNDKPIQGLSLSLHANSNTIRINGEIPAFRQVDENAIIWFNIPAKSHVSLQSEL